MTDTLELMYDAVPEGVPFIPSDAKIVAGYVDGHFRSYPELVARFHPRGARIVSIGVFLGHTADFTDVEPGNPINTPGLIRADFNHRKANGVWRPGYYADATRMANTVLPGLAGLDPSEYRLWLARWDGVGGLPPGIDAAKQFQNDPHYDVSTVDVQRMFRAAPKPPPPPKPPEKLPRAVVAYDPDDFSWTITNYPWGKEAPDPPKPAPKRKLSLASFHPKVVSATTAGGLATAAQGILHGLGLIHLTPAETGAITTALAALAGYFTPAK